MLKLLSVAELAAADIRRRISESFPEKILNVIPEAHGDANSVLVLMKDLTPLESIRVRAITNLYEKDLMTKLVGYEPKDIGIDIPQVTYIFENNVMSGTMYHKIHNYLISKFANDPNKPTFRELQELIYDTFHGNKPTGFYTDEEMGAE